MMIKLLEFWFQRNPARRGIEIYIGYKTTGMNPKTGWAKQIEFTEAPDDGSGPDFVEPALIANEADCQLLMDELWRIGLRPSEGTGSAGALAATQSHLKDMQDFARKMLDKILKEG